jgi:hypothetical protein
VWPLVTGTYTDERTTLRGALGAAVTDADRD